MTVQFNDMYENRHAWILEQDSGDNLFLHNSISQIMRFWESEPLIPPLNAEPI